VFDHTSVLKLIEWRWGLAPLTPRDASNDVQNLALNFSESDTSVPSLPEPQAPLIAAPCLANLGSGILSTGSTSAPPAEWQELGKLATTLGFTVN
jgi:phospholipase C